MKRFALPMAALLAVTSCASQSSVNQLAMLKSSCAGGDQKSCGMIPYQEQANRAEALANTEKAVTIAVLLPLLILGAAAEVRASQCYNPWTHTHYFC